MAVDLSPEAISTLLSGKYTSKFKPVVQVIEIKCTSTRTEVNSSGVKQHASYEEIVLSDGLVCEDVIIGVKIEEMILSKKLQKGSIVQLTHFSCSTHTYHSFISVDDLKVIRLNCIIVGDPKPFSGNKTPLVNKFVTPKSEEDHVGENANRKRKRQSSGENANRKRKRQSSDNKEDGEIGACFEKLEKLGWEEGPMYDTAVLLFGESSDYRKIWLHLKPKSCVNWVKNAGGKYGLLG